MNGSLSSRSSASDSAGLRQSSRRSDVQRAALILALLLCALTVSAQEPTPLRWTAHEAIPSRISDVLVGTNLTLDAWTSFRAEDGREKWAYLCRVGLTYAVTRALKDAFGRERPNGYDDHSTPSAHTAFATTSGGWRSTWGASFAFTVAWGRMAGGWHYATDTAFGAGLGWAARRLCDEVMT